MANLNAVILPAQSLKDGRHKIRISVSHNSKTRYIPTNIIIDSQKEFSKGMIRNRPDASYLNTKLRGIIQSYQETLDDLGNPNFLTCEELVAYLKDFRIDKNRTVQSIFDEYIQQSDTKESTKQIIKYTWNTIKSLFNVDIPICNFNRSMAASFLLSLKKKGFKSSTINVYFSLFKSIVKYAQTCGYVQFKIDPFAGLKKERALPRQSWLTMDEIKLIRDFPFKRKNHILWRDLFMLSYYLGGINITDLLDLKFDKNFSIVKYVRHKTERLNQDVVEFSVPEEAKEIIKRLFDMNGSKLNKHKTMINVAHLIKTIRKLTKIENVVFYSARKSFSQHALILGVNVVVIDYLLGHKASNGLGFTSSSLGKYIFVTPELATQGIRTVLDNLK